MRSPASLAVRPAIAVRLATAEDLDFVTVLATDAFAPYGDYSGILATWLGDPAIDTLVAELAGDPAGFAILGPSRPRRALALRGGELLALAVAPSQRHNGVGRRLLDAVERRARAGLMRELRLSTAATNLAARQLYASAGFVIQALDRRRYPSGHLALEMAKRL